MATIPDHPSKISIIGGSVSGKSNVLINLIHHQPDIDKIYLCVKSTDKAKYQFLMNKRESVGSEHCKDPKTFIEYSNDADDIYETIEEYHPSKKHKYSI